MNTWNIEQEKISLTFVKPTVFQVESEKIFTLWFGGGATKHTHRRIRPEVWTRIGLVEAIPSAESLIATLIESAGRPESLDSATRSRPSDARWWVKSLGLKAKRSGDMVQVVNLSWFIRQRVRRTQASPRRVCMVSFFFLGVMKVHPRFKIASEPGGHIPRTCQWPSAFFPEYGFSTRDLRPLHIWKSSWGLMSLNWLPNLSYYFDLFWWIQIIQI